MSDLTQAQSERHVQRVDVRDEDARDEADEHHAGT